MKVVGSLKGELMLVSELSGFGTLDRHLGGAGLYKGMNFSPVLVLREVGSKDEERPFD